MEGRNAGKKAILIEGARRVGKTTVVKAFAENEYDMRAEAMDFSEMTLDEVLVKFYAVFLAFPYNT